MEDSNKIKEILSNSGFSQEIGLIISLIEEAGEEVYLVGGAVRDALLGEMPGDFDFTTSALPQTLLLIFKEYKVLTHGLDFGTVTVLLSGRAFEITTYRSDEVYTNSRSPDFFKFGKSLKEDLCRRDFSVNAIAYYPDHGLIDYFNGVNDLQDRVLRAIGNPEKRFNEDALRILRLYRFSSNLGFKIEKETYNIALLSSKKIMKISKERVFAELKKTLSKEIHFDFLNQILGDTLGNQCFFKNRKKLDFFSQAFLLYFYLSQKESLASYILEKKYIKIIKFYESINNVINENELKGLFIKFIEKEKLDFAKIKELWVNVRLIKNIDLELADLEKVKPLYEASRVELQKKYSGKKLGVELFLKKKEFFFCS